MLKRLKFWTTTHLAEKDGGPGPHRTTVLLSPMTRWGQLRLDILHQGDPHTHDGVSDSWILPLTGYCEVHDYPDGISQIGFVRRLRCYYRPAGYLHRICWRGGGTYFIPQAGKVYTLVWHKASAFSRANQPTTALKSAP